MIKCSCNKYGNGPWQGGWCRVCWKEDKLKIRTGDTTTVVRVGTCRHQLEVIDPTDDSGNRCACPLKWTYECSMHGASTPYLKKEGVKTCSSCLQWQNRELNEVTDVPSMIAIGSYGMPGVVELNLKLIRYRCGEIPILVSDDNSPKDQQDLIKTICEKYGAHFKLTHDKFRIGHAGGDLGSFYHGLTYAKNNGIKVMCKLSQRYIINRHRWLQNSAKWFMDAGTKFGTASDRCIEGGSFFHVRSEALLLKVDNWLPHIEELIPKKLNDAAEKLVHRVAKKSGDMIVWSLLGGPDRHRKSPNILWHTSNTEKEYRDLANDFNVDLDQGRPFFNGGWITQPDHKWG